MLGPYLGGEEGQLGWVNDVGCGPAGRPDVDNIDVKVVAPGTVCASCFGAVMVWLRGRVVR